MPPRSRVLLWCVLLGALFLIPHAPRANDGRVVETRSYRVGDLAVVPTPDGVSVSLGEMPRLDAPGHPALPIDRRTVEAPAGMRLAEVRAVATGWTIHPLDAEPAPYAGSLAWFGEMPTRDPAAYVTGPEYPLTDAEHRHGGYLRGRRLESVDLHPVRYRPADRSLRLATGFRVEYVFEPDPEAPVEPRPAPWDAERRFDRAADRLVTVGAPRDRDRVIPLVNGQEPFSPRFRPSEDGSPVRYLIITTAGLTEYFQRLADWKTALGMPAVVRSLDWIGTNYPSGVDLAEDVRNFIKVAVEEWGVEYVLIGGDVDTVPIRLGKSYFFGGEEIPTDLYMACLDGNWAANGDDLFGEAYFNATYPGDGADIYPEVWIGRASVRNNVEATVFVDKVLAYETQVPLGSSFSTSMLSLGEMLFPQTWSQGDTVLFDGADVCELAVALANGPTLHNRMYENYTAFPGSVPEIKLDVIAEINAGYNIVLHVGHGFRNTMAVGINGETLGNGDADAFTNGDRQGLLYAINCTSSALDFDCIAEHITRNPNGGAVASIGSTRLDFPSTGQLYQQEFFDLIYQQGVTRIGEAHAQQRFPFIASSNRDGEHRWTQYNLIYLGDPDLDLHTDSVDELFYSVTESFELGQAAYTVTVTDNGGPVAGATVCLNKDGDAYGYALTDGSGVATVLFDPDRTGPASIGVRAHNHLSRVDTVSVGTPAGVHLFTDGLVVDDSVGGDGDGALEAGETASLIPSITNGGGTGATAVALTVIASPPEITVTDPLAAFPDIGPGSTLAALDPIGITVDPGVRDTTLTLTVQLDAAGYTRQEPLVLYVGGPSIDHYQTVYADTAGNGNGDGTLQAGEDQVLCLDVINLGLGRSENLTAVLTSSDPAVTILDGISGYGDLQPGASGCGDGFQFRFSDTSLAHDFDVTFTDQRGAFLVKTFNLLPPSAATGLKAAGGATSITLRWSPNPEADIRGYNIYRSAVPGGPYARVNPTVTDEISYYRNENLPPLTRYYYQVSAVDVDGNESGVSIEAQATTSLPSHEGYPLLVNASASSSPGLAYLNGDTKAEIVSGGNEVFVTTDAGVEYLDGDLDAQTYGVFAETGFGPFWSPPAVGDVDGDGVVEIAACGWASGQLYLWDSRGDIRPGWPQNVNIDVSATPNIWSAPSMADVDNDGKMEIFINAGKYTCAFNDDGTELIDGDSDPVTTGVFLVMGAGANYSTPALSDVDNDGDLEVIVGSRDGKLYVTEADGTPLPNFPYVSGGEITNSPAIGDLDKDGLKEIVFANSIFQVEAIDINLNSPPNWPVGANMNRDYDASPALADLDGDTFLDVIVCAGNGTVYAFRGQNGLILPGWGFVLYDAAGAKVGLSSSPAVGNLDADPDLEVCFGGNDGNLYAFNLDATAVDGFPIGTNNKIEGGPLLWDIDDDGLTEVVAQSLDEQVYVWDSPGVFDPSYQPWPMFHQNSRRTGEVESEVWITVGTPDEPGSPSPVLAANVPNPFSSRTAIAYRVPEGAGTRVRLRVFDVSGRLVRTLVDGAQPPGSYTSAFDGRDDAGRVLGGGMYFYKLEVGPEAYTRKMVLVP